MVDIKNKNFENLCKLIKLNPLDYQKRTGNEESYNDFIAHFPAKKITEIKLDEYCIGTGNQDNFCWWIEYGLANILGGYSARGASGHFIYKRREDGSVQRHNMVASLSEENALKAVLSIHSVIANADINDIDWIDNDKSLCDKADVRQKIEFGDGRKLRILSIYHPDEVIPISNSDHLKHFLVQLGFNPEKIPDKNEPIARMKLLLEYYFEAKKHNKNLTPYGFMSVLYSNELNIRPEKAKKRNTEEINAVNVIDKKKSLLDIELPLNQILYGPPGTGKTYNTVNLALELLGKKQTPNETRNDFVDKFRNYLITDVEKDNPEKRIIFTTFHQSYGYEDFVEGIKVEKVESTKELSYDVKPGVFKALCDKARDDEGKKPYVIIIDEINRGNISKIFGELITLIEPDKRTGEDEGITVILPYSKEPFSVPNNVHIIGTMNTADASLAKLDIALRRRFDFIEMPPEPKLITVTKKEGGVSVVVQGVNLSAMLTEINKRIEVLYDRDHTIGHSFLMKLSNDSKISDLEDVFRKNIIPLLQEYFFEDWERIHWVLGDHLKSDNNYKFIIENNKKIIKLMGEKWNESYGNDQGGKLWKLNKSAFFEPSSYIGIYDSASINGKSSDKDE